jgi:hypothetical protein
MLLARVGPLTTVLEDAATAIGAGVLADFLIRLVGFSILIAGALVFRGSSEAGMQATVLVAFIGGSAVYYYLDQRAQKRKRKRSQ